VALATSSTVAPSARRSIEITSSCFDGRLASGCDSGSGVGSRKLAQGKVLNDDRADWRQAYALFTGDVAYVWHGALHGSSGC